MKLKEVCTETGLSRKTIRLYEEKGLLVPQKEYRNGREYREYTEEDITRLKVIALLRKSWFTMEEIKRMMNHPETIAEIVPQYVSWLKLQKFQVDALLSAAESLDLSTINNAEKLSRHMADAAENLPLPKWDITPKFKHLDELEANTMMSKNDNKRMEETNQKTFRQTTLIMDQDKVNNHAITFGQIKELKNGDYSKDGPVKNEVRESPATKIITRIGLILFIAGFLVFGVMELAAFMGLSTSGISMNPTALYALIVMVVGIAMYGIAHGYTAYQERQRWLKVVRAQDEEKKKQG